MAARTDAAISINPKMRRLRSQPADLNPTGNMVRAYCKVTVKTRRVTPNFPHQSVAYQVLLSYHGEQIIGPPATESNGWGTTRVEGH